VYAKDNKAQRRQWEQRVERARYEVDLARRQYDAVDPENRLVGRELDLNNTPDALPAFAVVGCYAQGQTVLGNVAQARIKETDRIKVMAEELTKMGAQIEEMDDGLIIHQSNLTGAHVHGHHDHRVVMALSLAGMMADGETKIDTAESVDITFPGYVEKMCQLGAQMQVGV